MDITQNIEKNFDIIANLPSDVRRKILLDYFKDPRSIFTLCSVHTKYKDLICNDQKLWELLLVRDFPEAFYTSGSLGLTVKNFKNAYIRNVIRDETFLRDEARRLANKYSWFREDQIFNDLIKYQNNRIGGPVNMRSLYSDIYEQLDRKNQRHLEQRQEVLDAWKTGKRIPPPIYYQLKK